MSIRTALSATTRLLTAILVAGSSAVWAQSYGDQKTSSCRNSHTVCEDCNKNQFSLLTGTTCPIGTKSPGNSLVDNIGFEHHHDAWDYIAGPSPDGKGCGPCGSSAGERPGVLPGLSMRRVHRYRFGSFPSSFGPGVYLDYNHHLELNRTDATTGSGSILYFFTNARGRVTLSDTASLYGDTVKDGIYHDNAFANISELRLLDANGTLVTDQALAVHAVLCQHNGSRHTFEIINTTTNPTTTQRWGRLIRQEDPNGNAVVITYAFARTATDAEMGSSRAKLWNLSTITDAYGRVATVTYRTTQVAGRWVVSGIAMPNGTTVAYGYDANGLSTVTYPDGSVSTITRSSDTALQQTVISYVEAGAEGTHRRKESRLTTSSYLNPDGTTSSQTSGMIRSVKNGAGEYSYFNQEDPGNNQVVLVYEGGNKLYRLTTSGFDHMRKTEVATNWSYGQPLTGLTFQVLETYETNGQAMITKRTDILGRATVYAVTAKAAVMSRITHPDATFQKNDAYTAFAQPTLVTDRLGRITENLFDAKGNRTKRTEAKGTSAEASWTWTYNARGQVLEARDALYDSAKPDLHVTSYVYDTKGYLVSILESADVAGGVRPTRTFTYDAAGRLSSTSDPDGRRVDYTYDSRNRVTKIAYGGNVGITDDFETFTFATSGQDVNLLTQHRDRNGNLTGFTYDAAGRKTRTTFAVGQADATGTKDCTYLTGTELLASCIEFGEKVSYGYDYLNRRITSARQARTGTVLTDTITYDNARRVVSTSDPYGRRTFLVYDINDRVIRTVRDLIVAGTPATPAPASLTRVTTANPPYVVEDTTFDAEGQATSRIDPRGITHTFAYDAQGRLTEQVQAAVVPAGLTALAYKTVFEHDKQGNRTKVIHPRSLTEGAVFATTATFSGRNLRLSETEASTRTEAATRSWTYTKTGKQATAKDFKDQTTSFTYYPCCDRVKDVIEPGSFKTTYGYDKHGNVVTVTDPNLNTTTTAYDGRHRVKRVTNAENEATAYTYDDNGADAVGLSSTYAAKLTGLNLGAGSDGSLVEVTNPVLEKSVQVRDGLGRVVRTVHGNGNATTTAYDTVNLSQLQVEVTDALGHKTRTRADAAGRVRASEDALNQKTVIGYDPNGNRVSIRDPNNVGQDCVFDAANRDIQCTDTASPPAVTKRTYDAHGNVVSETDALGKITTHQYDPRDRKTRTIDRLVPTPGQTVFAYDKNNNLLKITDAEARVTDYAYDARNLLVTEIYPPGDTTQTAGTNKRTYTYDAGRRLKTRTDQTGAVTTYAYDKANRLLSRSYPDALNDTFVYDDASRLTSATSARFTTTVARSYTASGEKGGRLRSETQTVRGYAFTVGYGYDADNRTTTITYPNGKQVTRAYTARHQLSGTSYDGASIATRAYDNGGRFTTTTYGNTLIETRTYKPDNTVATIAVPGVTNFSYTYDGNKRKTYEGHQFSTDWQEFAYDPENRLTTWKRDGQETQSWTLTQVGDWASTTRNGTTENRTHTPVHEIKTSVIGGVTTTLAHDQKGNLTIDRNGQRYDWDVENRLHAARAGASTSGYVYDALGRRLGKTALGTTTTYVHDGAQVIAEYEAPMLQSSDIGSPTLAGSFSNSGTGSVTVSGAGTDIWGTSDQFRYAYLKLTGNGSITARLESQYNTDHWAKAGVMLRDSLAANAQHVSLFLTPNNGLEFQVRATTGGTSTSATTGAGTASAPIWVRLTRVGTAVTAARSADGLTWTTVNTGTVTYTQGTIYAGLAVTSHNVTTPSAAVFTNVTTTGNVQTTASPTYARGYVYGSYVDELLAILPASGVVGDRKFVHNNHLYSVAALTDNSGNVVERYRYDAYGQRTVLAADGATTRTASSYGNQYGFTGRFLDKETGLWYFRARYYSGSLGRFVSRDPDKRLGTLMPRPGDGYADGQNLYAGYFAPNHLDPNGTICVNKKMKGETTSHFDDKCGTPLAHAVAGALAQSLADLMEPKVKCKTDYCMDMGFMHGYKVKSCTTLTAPSDPVQRSEITVEVEGTRFCEDPVDRSKCVPYDPDDETSPPT